MDITMNWVLQILFLPLIVSNIVFLHFQKQKRVDGKAKYLARMYKWGCSS